MNKARHIYEGHFIIRDSLIESVVGDQVQSKLACANLLLPSCFPGYQRYFCYGFKMQKKKKINEKKLNAKETS